MMKISDRAEQTLAGVLAPVLTLWLPNER